VPNTNQEIQDLGYRVWIQHGFFAYKYMKEAPIPLYQQLLSEAMVSKTTSYIPPEDVHQLTLSSKIALVLLWNGGYRNKYADYGNGKGIVGAHGLCTIRRVPEQMYVATTNFGLPKNSPIANLINYRILLLHAAVDTNNRWEDKKYTTSCLEPPSPSPEPTAFRLDQMASVFIIWMAGILLACLTAIMELICHCYVSLPAVNHY
ncbi:unnamed protein product, partial [Meganyctiphanes norvegica]